MELLGYILLICGLIIVLALIISLLIILHKRSTNSTIKPSDLSINLDRNTELNNLHKIENTVININNENIIKNTTSVRSIPSTSQIRFGQINNINITNKCANIVINPHDLYTKVNNSPEHVFLQNKVVNRVISSSSMLNKNFIAPDVGDQSEVDGLKQLKMTIKVQNTVNSLLKLKETDHMHDMKKKNKTKYNNLTNFNVKKNVEAVLDLK